MTTDPAAPMPAVEGAEALARLWTRFEQVGDVWDELHPADREHRLDTARRVLAAGYLSPEAVAERVAAAKGELAPFRAVLDANDEQLHASGFLTVKDVERIRAEAVAAERERIALAIEAHQTSRLGGEGYYRHAARIARATPGAVS